jgi:hypothetical protein
MTTRLRFARVADSVSVMAGLSGNTRVRRVDDFTIELLEEPTPRTLKNVRAFARDVEITEA